MTNIADYIKYFEEFGFEDPEFFKSGHAIQQCQAYLLEQIMAGVTPEDLIVSETNCLGLNRTDYVGGINKLVAVALSFSGAGVVDIYNWAAQYDKLGKVIINNHMDSITLKLKPHLSGMLAMPMSLSMKEIYKNKEIRYSFGEFNTLNDNDQIMNHIETDNQEIVDLIVKSSSILARGKEILYLRLAKYNETLNVRKLLLGTIDLTRSDIHQKLLGQFSFVDKDNRGISSTFYPRWDSGLIEVPAVKNYLVAHGEQVLNEVLSSRDYSARNSLHSTHEESCRDRQVELLDQCIQLVKPTREACAKLFYSGIKYENSGFLLDLLERKDWIKQFCIDLAGDDSEKPLYEQAVKSFIQIIGVPTIVSAIATVPDDAQADELIASLYKKTNDASLPSRLKNLTVLARVFCDDLSI
jgi:hypothetical protein